MRGNALVLSLLLLVPAHVALAQEGERASEPEEDLPPVAARPTSGEASLHSGRTLGIGQTMIAGAAGWPGIWVLAEHAISSTFNFGVRAGLTYGSVMALAAGVGGELGIPMRIHVFGEGDVDLAVYLEPAFSVAEGASVGETATIYAGDLGWSGRLELGGLLGFRAGEGLTLLVGVGGLIGHVHVPAAGDPTVIGGILGRFGIEGLISRDTMLFAVSEAGIGFADDSGRGATVFDAGLVSAILRLSLGLAYLL